MFLTLDLPTCLQPGLYPARRGWDMGHRPLAYLLRRGAAAQLVQRASARGGVRPSVAQFLVDNEAGLASFWWVGGSEEPLVVHRRPHHQSEPRSQPGAALLEWTEACRAWRQGAVPQGVRQPTDIAACGFRTRLSVCPPLEELYEGYSSGAAARCLPTQSHCACSERWGRGMGCAAANAAFHAGQMPRAVVAVDETSWLARDLPEGMHACGKSVCAVVHGFDAKIDHAPQGFATVYLAHLNSSRANARGDALFPAAPPGSSRLNAVLATESPALTRAAFESLSVLSPDIVVSYFAESPGAGSLPSGHAYERVSFIRDPLDRCVARAGLAEGIACLPPPAPNPASRSLRLADSPPPRW